jgi:hypothetical protein
VGSSLQHNSMHELCLHHDEDEEDIIFLEVYSTLWQVVVLLERELRWCLEVSEEEDDLEVVRLQQ